VFTAERITPSDMGPSKVAKYGDTSAAYWNLYASEADVFDKKYVERLKGDTESMIILVR
jgi:hypothetical protein